MIRQITFIESTLEQYDKNKTGGLDPHEASQLSKSFIQKATAEKLNYKPGEIRKIFNIMDINGDGEYKTTCLLKKIHCFCIVFFLSIFCRFFFSNVLQGFFFLVNRWIATCYQNSRKSLPEPQNLVSKKVCQKYFTKFFHGNTSNCFCLIYFLFNVGQKQVFVKYILSSELFA